MLDRIQQILKSKNLTPSKFAEEIGVQRSAMSHLLSGRNNPSLEFIQKLLSRYPEIRTDWLLTGKGQMFKELQLFEQDFATQQESNKTEFTENKQDLNKPKELNSDIEPLPSPVNQQFNNPAVPSIPLPHSAGKTIDKIVIFYSDRSFSEYYPENNNF